MATEKSGEFRGKTVDAAVSNGLVALGVARDAVEVEVVRPGSRGLLGIGAEDAVVRLRVIGGGAAAPARSERPAEAPTRPAGPSRTERPVDAPRSEPPMPRPETPRGEGRPPRQERQGDGAPRARTERRDEGPGRQSRERQQPPARQPDRQPDGMSAPRPAAQPLEGDTPVPEAMEKGREYLAGLLQRMNMKADVQIVQQTEAETAGERSLVLNIVGDDLGILIGRQSEVLTAVQFITRLMVNQQTKSRSNLVIDVNGYKAKRAESLRKLALRTAEQVQQTGRVMALEPMPPAERRIIHLALRNHPDVASQSVGEGNRRKVTIVPKK